MKEYKTITRIAGPLIFVAKTEPIGYADIVKIALPNGEIKNGQVLDTSDDIVVVQVFEGTAGIDVDSRVKFLGDTLKLSVSKDMLGRVLSGSGKPIDSGPEIIPEKRLDIMGAAINPYARASPHDFIQTGISTIDAMNTLVRGQKLPIFSGSGLPHNEIALQIARQAKVVGKQENFVVVFAAMGITNEEAQYFINDFRQTGALERSVVFLNLANDPAVERLVTPKMALTAAEYFAYEHDAHVLVILTDMTNYCVAGDTEIFFDNGDIFNIKDFVGLLSDSTDKEIEYKNKIVTWDGAKGVSKRVSRVQKLPTTPYIINIKTRSGNSICVTPNHRILTDSIYGPKMLMAELLRKGDKILSLSKIHIGHNTFSILDMLEDNFILIVKKDFLKDINHKLKSKYKTIKKASKELGFDYSRFTNAKDMLSICDYKKLKSEINAEELLGNIIYISTIGGDRRKIGFKFINEDLMYLLGLVSSDGSLILNNKSGINRVDFSNKNEDLLRNYKTKFGELLPDSKLKEFKNQNGVTILRADNILYYRIAKFFNIKKDFKIIFKLPENHISSFLKGYLDGDGYCNIGKRCIIYTTKEKLIATRLQQLLKRIGISSAIIHRKSKGTFGYSDVFDIKITGKRDLELFCKSIKSEHTRKLASIEKLMSYSLDGCEFDLAPKICGTLLRLLRKKYKINQKHLGKSSTISMVESGFRNIDKAYFKEWTNKIKSIIQKEDPLLSELEKLCSNEFILDEITDIRFEKPSELFVYDLTVPETGKFIVDKGVIISNCESLREIGAAREEIPGRRGYPGYMYTDLATIYERAGVIKGKKGSVTQIPILTMVGDDITHPIPDLTGYITEGQIVLARELHRKGVYPSIDVLPSLSRLMNLGIGPTRTRDDHKQASDQMYAAYAEGRDLRGLVAIVGEEALSDRDKRLLKFAAEFEDKFVRQKREEDRSIAETLELGWKLLGALPENELTRISPELKKKYYKQQ